MWRRKKSVPVENPVVVYDDDSSVVPDYGNGNALENREVFDSMVSLRKHEVENYSSIVKHQIDASVATTTAIADTLSTIANAKAETEKARMAASVQMAQVQSDFIQGMTEEENCHEEVMAHGRNLEKMVDNAIASSNLSDDSAYMMKLLDAIAESGRQSVEIRKTKTKRR